VRGRREKNEKEEGEEVRRGGVFSLFLFLKKNQKNSIIKDKNKKK